MSQPKITIYSTPFCAYCKLTKQYFDEHNFKYKEIDVSNNESGQKEMVAISGQMGVPVIVIEKAGQKEVLLGFQKDKLVELLNIKK